MNIRYQKGNILPYMVMGTLILGFVSLIAAMITALTTKNHYLITCTNNDGHITELSGYNPIIEDNMLIYYTDPEYTRNVHNISGNENCKFNKLK